MNKQMKSVFALLIFIISVHAHSADSSTEVSTLNCSSVKIDLSDLSKISVLAHDNDSDPAAELFLDKSDDTLSYPNIVEQLLALDMAKYISLCKSDSYHVKNLLEYVKNINLIADLASKSGKDQFGVIAWRIKLDELKRLEYSIKYQLSNISKAGEYLDIAEFQEILDGVGDEEKSKLINANKSWYETKEKDSFNNNQKALALSRQELDLLLKKMTYTSLTSEEKARRDTLLNDPEVMSSADVDIPLSTFRDYPYVVSRFTAGVQFLSTTNLASDVTPTIGFFYYRSPLISDAKFLSADGTHWGTELSVAKIKTSEEDVNYSVELSQLAFKPWGYKEVNSDGVKVQGGLAVEVGAYVYESEADSGDKELVYLGSLYTGYRAAYSPERYMQFAVGRCIRTTKDIAPECFTRLKVEFKTDVPGIIAEDKIQIGLELSYKTREKDITGNSVAFTLRYNTSFGELFSKYSK
ncbi:hypothetical protein [Thalassolituus oleivorans]|uniref:hypothetical protein n=1 Tax=Thalassolituus oleivorans TaxID=187493 RepID=UPI00042DDE12|nr:hypothetical protein [Thalassolituus oleivorans]AHK17242.1 hypothetical protein R615_01975 [Thalassolituus oleivorans R6-15]MCA6128098.1 hypothetical protein [Thalassolituus oleivorans 4BN06-13]